MKLQLTIDDLKALQHERGIAEHVVWISPFGFVIAHTDKERATIDLEECPLHLSLLKGQHCADGYYVVTERGDSSARWHFESLQVA